MQIENSTEYLNIMFQILRLILFNYNKNLKLFDIKSLFYE